MLKSIQKSQAGQIVYGLGTGNFASYFKGKIFKFTIHSVKTKFVELIDDGGRVHIVEKEGFKSKEDCNSGYDLFETLQDIEDLKEIKVLADEIYKTFEYGRNRKNLSLDKIKRIADIINEG